MARWFLGVAALAFLSSACTVRMQTPAREAAQVDYSDHSFYNQTFGDGVSAWGSEQPTQGQEQPPGGLLAAPQKPSTELQSSGRAFADTRPSHRETAEGGVEASSVEYEEVAATPGTACYDAALQAGITSGTCTLISERKYMLVGERRSAESRDAPR